MTLASMVIQETVILDCFVNTKFNTFFHSLICSPHLPLQGNIILNLYFIKMEVKIQIIFSTGTGGCALETRSST